MQLESSLLGSQTGSIPLLCILYKYSLQLLPLFLYSLISRVGQQCCYDNSGDLIVGHPGGGSVDRVSQESSRVEHFLQDVYPFVVCCKGRLPDCSKYYEDRPSDDGSNFVPPTPPGILL